MSFNRSLTSPDSVDTVSTFKPAKHHWSSPPTIYLTVMCRPFHPESRLMSRGDSSDVNARNRVHQTKTMAHVRLLHSLQLVLTDFGMGDTRSAQQTLSFSQCDAFGPIDRNP
jgi:hypothetical protein